MRRRGMTLIEMMVVVLIIGVLMALIIPAVAASREAARRAQCVGHLKQLLLAVHNYHTIWNALPPTASTLGDDFAMKVRLLPYFERTEVYNSINFGLPHDAPENTTIRAYQIGNLICPSDPSADRITVKSASELGAQSYPNNIGTYLNNHNGRLDGPAYEFGDAVNGKAISFNEITDGTSMTAIFAEWRIGSVALGQESDAIFWSSDLDNSPIPIETLSGNCGAAREVASQAKGSDWLDQNCGNGGGYSHIMNPNAKGCFFGSGGYARDRTMIGASSHHFGGVNVGMADGMIRFIRNGVDPAIWRGMSTIAGGESIDPESY